MSKVPPTLGYTLSFVVNSINELKYYTLSFVINPINELKYYTLSFVVKFDK
ncbi:hypothetical protein HanIR_Chr13g0635931 [Helianthus annuus]|nr:hypothetical protein HanIR_Chr13g0635931 [Helianthus annuus]